MRNRIKLFRKIEKEFHKTIYAFLNAPFSFYLERDIECYMYSVIAKKIPYLTEELFPIMIDKKKRYDTLLHSQVAKSRKDFIEKSSIELDGYFDLAIHDDELMSKDDLNLFMGIEIKHGYSLNCKLVRKDIINLLNKENRLEYGFMFNFIYYDNVGITERQINNLRKSIKKDLKKINSKTKIFYYFIYVDYKKPENKGIFLAEITKSHGKFNMNILCNKTIGKRIDLNSLKIDRKRLK